MIIKSLILNCFHWLLSSSELDINQDKSAGTAVKSKESLKKDQEEKSAKKEKKNQRKEAEVTNTSKSTGSTVTAQVPQVLPERKGGPRQKLLIKPGGLWYDLVSDLQWFNQLWNKSL